MPSIPKIQVLDMGTTYANWGSTIAQTLGLNWDSTNRVLYAGSDSNHGFYFTNNSNFQSYFYNHGQVPSTRLSDGGRYLHYLINSNGDIMFGLTGDITKPKLCLCVIKGTLLNTGTSDYGYYASTVINGGYWAINSAMTTQLEYFIFQSAAIATFNTVSLIKAHIQKAPNDDVFIPDKAYYTIVFKPTLSGWSNVIKLGDKYFAYAGYNDGSPQFMLDLS